MLVKNTELIKNQLICASLLCCYGNNTHANIRKYGKYERLFQK
jgi:hypothetical protein